MISVSSKLHIPKLARLASKLPHELQEHCDKTALDIEADAKGRAPVRTGFLRRSIYSVTSKGSDYQGEGESLPRLNRPPGISALVGVAAPYGLAVELGTHRMGAQPYITPAVEAQGIPFASDLKRVMD